MAEAGTGVETELQGTSLPPLRDGAFSTLPNPSPSPGAEPQFSLSPGALSLPQEDCTEATRRPASSTGIATLVWDAPKT